VSSFYEQFHHGSERLPSFSFRDLVLFVEN
jgi:hypothetical protein